MHLAKTTVEKTLNTLRFTRDRLLIDTSTNSSFNLLPVLDQTLILDLTEDSQLEEIILGEVKQKLDEAIISLEYYLSTQM